MSTVDSQDLKNRDRTFADRKAFLLSESAAQTAAALLASKAATGASPAVITESAVDPNWRKGRDRQSERDSLVAAQRGAFLRVLGEMVYRSMPFDDHEKRPHHATVISQTAELAESISGGWKLSPAGVELMETAAGVVLGVEDRTPEALEAAIAESIASGELGPMVEHLCPELEQRVVAAVAANADRVAEIEQRLQEAAAVSDGDAELAELRARRVLRRHSAPSLIESLFVANRRALSESTGQEVSAGVLMMEAVSQYTLLETLSAVGVMPMEGADAEAVAKRLLGRG